MAIVDLHRHSEILRSMFTSAEGDIHDICMAGMRIGAAKYDKPNAPDERDYRKEARDELRDALNYIGIEYARMERENDQTRYLLVEPARHIVRALKRLR